MVGPGPGLDLLIQRPLLPGEYKAVRLLPNRPVPIQAKYIDNPLVVPSDHKLPSWVHRHDHDVFPIGHGLVDFGEGSPLWISGIGGHAAAVAVDAVDVPLFLAILENSRVQGGNLLYQCPPAALPVNLIHIDAYTVGVPIAL